VDTTGAANPDATASFDRCPFEQNEVRVLGFAGIDFGVGPRLLPKMKISLSRSWILRATVILIILATLPGAIRRILQTGNLYLFTEHFFGDLLARLSGPGRLRFIVQPIVAILLGARDGAKDARAKVPAFLSALAFHGRHRRDMLRNAFVSAGDLVAIAVLLDLIAQSLIFREIHPGAALLVGPMLVGIPYALSRQLGNRLSGEGGRLAHPRRQGQPKHRQHSQTITR
jgi:hypothetical protein